MNKPTTARTMVPLKALKNARYNPEGRTRVDQKMRDLLTSLDLLGQLSPILIDPKRNIIDGHRRTAAAKLLGWTELEAVIISDATPESIYSSINAVSKPMTGNDALMVYTVNKEACPPRIRFRLQRFEDLGGMDLLKDVAAKGRSPTIFKTALNVLNYLDKKEDGKLFQQIVKWLDKKNYVVYIEKLMANGLEPNDLFRAIKLNGELRTGLKVVSAVS